MSKIIIEPLPVSLTFLGESPHWDARTQKLYYIDIDAKAVHSYDPATKEEGKIVIKEKAVGEESVGLVIPVENAVNKFVIGFGRSFSVLEWDGKADKSYKLKTLQVSQDDNPNGRFNDGKCDSSGRLWSGSMGVYDAGHFPPGEAKKGRLYTLEKDGSLKDHLKFIDISNGLAWSPDDKTFYYIDSLTYLVEAFDFDLVKGSISNRRKVFDLKAHNIAGTPDGMCVDVNGNLWVAVFGGSKILHIHPKTGKLINAVEMPALNMTSVTFGGPNLDILYATSSQKNMSKEQLAAQPLAGAVFQLLNTGTRGHSAGINYGGKV